MNLPTSDSNEFDYSTLDNEVRIVVEQRTTEIKSLMRRTVQDIIEIGQKLTDVKAKLGHGNFIKWLKYEFEWQERSARNFMRVADVFKSAKFADLDIAASALYLLAAPSIPEQVRQTALGLANEGETITYTKAKSIIDEYKKNKYIDAEIINTETLADETVTMEGTDSSKIQLNQSPVIKVSAQTQEQLQIDISYVDVNLSVAGSKEDLVAFLAQIQSNPSFADEILQQIEFQTDD